VAWRRSRRKAGNSKALSVSSCRWWKSAINAVARHLGSSHRTFGAAPSVNMLGREIMARAEAGRIAAAAGKTK
jgi:hypothetical protein